MKKHLVRQPFLAWIVLLLGFAPPTFAQAVSSGVEVRRPSEFLRLTRDSEGHLRTLETATIRYRSSTSGLTVDLIAVVHFAVRNSRRETPPASTTERSPDVELYP